MSTDPSDPLTPSTEPEVLPSSTPDGPQTIPAPGPGEPAPEAQPGQLDEPTRASNPSSGGPAGLSGDLGISSERTGPAGSDPRGFDIAGTGSVGGAVDRTDGGFDTSPTAFDAPDVSQRDVNPMPEGSETMTGAGNTPGGQANPGDIDRTVGEPMPNPIPDEKSRRGTHEPGPSRAR
jgi:hypothetical protein